MLVKREGWLAIDLDRHSLQGSRANAAHHPLQSLCSVWVLERPIGSRGLPGIVREAFGVRGIQMPAPGANRFEVELAGVVSQVSFDFGREGASHPGGLPLLDGFHDRQGGAKPLRRVRRIRVSGQLGRAGQARGEGEAGVETCRARQQPLSVFNARVGTQREPAEHVRHQVALEMQLVLETIERLAFPEAGIPRLAPVHAGVYVPIEVARVAGVVDLPLEFRRQRIIPRLGEQRPPILPHARGVAPLQAVEGDLERPGMVAELGDVPRDFLREIGVREKDLVVMIHQFGCGNAAVMRCRAGAPGATLTAEQTPRGIR